MTPEELKTQLLKLADEIVAQLRPMTPVPSADTLEDEKAAYRQWGWTWTPLQEPEIDPGSYTIPAVINVHQDTEADDLWQNAVMWQRTGKQGYRDLAAAWADYYLNHYLNDLKKDYRDRCHTYGWGLVLWSMITGDRRYLFEAIAIGDYIEISLNSSEPDGIPLSMQKGLYGHRGPGRQLKLAVALGRRAMADKIWNNLRDGGTWDERGFWAIQRPASIAEVAGPGLAFSVMEFGTVSEGLAAYFEMTGDAEVKRRLIAMARFAATHGLHPTYQHSGSWILPEQTGDSYRDLHFDFGPPVIEPAYTTYFINTLVRGWQLTGDISLLNRAIYHWDRASRAIPGSLNRLPDDKVGHFMNGIMHGSIYYEDEGELACAGLLFKAAADARQYTTWAIPVTPPPIVGEGWSILPNSSLDTQRPSYWQSPGPDGYSYPLDNIINDWNGGIIDTKGRRLILPANGGHSSWFYNDVLALDLVNGGWSVLKKSYLPYIPLADKAPAKYPDGSPSTVHTYDGIVYDGAADEIVVLGGPTWGGSGGSYPHWFNIQTREWSWSAQGQPPFGMYNGICSAIDTVTGKIYFNPRQELYEYDRKMDTHTLVSEDLGFGPSYGKYHTGLWIAGLFYAFGHGEVRKVVPGQRGDTLLTLTGDNLPTAPAPGVAWEPDIPGVVLWGGGRDLYLIDVVAMTVIKKTLPGDDPGAPSIHGTYKRFGRFGAGQYVLMNSIKAVHIVTLKI